MQFLASSHGAFFSPSEGINSSRVGNGSAAEPKISSRYFDRNNDARRCNSVYGIQLSPGPNFGSCAALMYDQSRRSSYQAQPQQLVINVPPLSPTPIIPMASSTYGSITSSSSAITICHDLCEQSRLCCALCIIILGQLMSLCLGGTAVSSQVLANNGFNAPTAQVLGSYFLLALIYGCALLFRSRNITGNDQSNMNTNFGTILHQRGWRYFLLAFIDLEANFLIVKAYQYTNLTSIQLLDCFTVPVVMILSFVFLATRYFRIHFLGVSICLVGIFMTIYTDATHGKGLEGGSNRLLGDVLCLLAAILYSICNVCEEFLVKQNDRTEYLGLVGFFGFCLATVQLGLLESQALATFKWSPLTLGMYAVFTVSMFFFYSIVSIVMQKSSALMFNLSILTADFYSLLAGIFIFEYSLHFFYLVSFCVVIIGSTIYSSRPTQKRSIPMVPHHLNPDQSSSPLPNNNNENRLVNRLCDCCCPCLTISNSSDSEEEMKTQPQADLLAIANQKKPSFQQKISLSPRSSSGPLEQISKNSATNLNNSRAVSNSRALSNSLNF